MNEAIEPVRTTTSNFGACNPSRMSSQFGLPRGALGWAVGKLMTIKNAGMHRLAAESIDAQPDDRILEIGFGSGSVIHTIARRRPKADIAGVDPSEVMLGQASRRNREHIEAGRVELKPGSASRLPFEDGRFTKVFAVNSFRFWSDQEADLREVYRVMAEGGLLVLCLRMEHPRRRFLVAPGFTIPEIEGVKHLLMRAGFSGVRTETRSAGRMVTCVFAEKALSAAVGPDREAAKEED